MVTAFVLIQTEVGRVSEVGEKLSQLPGVEFADEITGPYDVIARVIAEDLTELGNSVTTAIARIPGVTRTLTCPTTKSIKLHLT